MVRALRPPILVVSPRAPQTRGDATLAEVEVYPWSEPNALSKAKAHGVLPIGRGGSEALSLMTLGYPNLLVAGNEY